MFVNDACMGSNYLSIRKVLIKNTLLVYTELKENIELMSFLIVLLIIHLDDGKLYVAAYGNK